ncbi:MULTISPECIES: helix-turn-helix domain-containing protein [unclassified Mesorhizobium]|uniref:helix-turn-helix domain-containing protein n=1 Tax=unclassified Mesorhizobium TaxID=325217 RepID=UPI00112D9219|nr:MULTISPECIES: helix-turn-helix domain-containing protein [unclassified Mesorhizobium]TPK59052.1 MarR family transcriptional regulator [Mesorhizobium sp. B2-5-1]TPL06667.1 MarR family transcriptional regulator [Mesorhizobium sp. B2-4-11]
MTIRININDDAVGRVLADEAVKRGCNPGQLAVALIHCAAQGALFDAILDDVDPGNFSALGRTSLQVRVLKALKAFEAPNGMLVASFLDIATYLGLNSRGPVSTAIAALVDKGMIERAEAGRQGVPSRYRMTVKAQLLLKELAR